MIPVRLLIASLLLTSIAALPAHAASPATSQLVPLPGSVVPQLANTRSLGQLSPSRAIGITLALRIRHRDALDALVRAEYTPGSPSFHRFLHPAQFAARFAPLTAARSRIAGWLTRNGLDVRSISRNGLEIIARGPAAHIEAAFGTAIHRYRRGSTVFFANTGPIHLPEFIVGSVVAVTGLNSLPDVHPLDLPIASRTPALPGSDPQGLAPAALAALYDLQPIYNAGFSGAGQTIALFQLSDYQDANIAAFDTQFGIAPPDIERVAVKTGSRVGAVITNNEDECELDIEIAHSVAPQAKLLVYEGNAALPIYNQIVSDDRAQVISTSYGATESHQLLAGDDPDSYILAQDQIFEEAAAQGQGVFAPAGDNGAYDAAEVSVDPNKMSPQVDFPASDPWVTGVGATTLDADGTTEVPWAETNTSNPTGTGGGLSAVFKQPWYQSGPGVTNSYTNGMRQVPDLSAYGGALAGGRAVYVGENGSAGWQQIVGTSASTPFIAALAALINQYLGQTIGFLNPTLYLLGQRAATFSTSPYYDVTSGTNLLYSATPGWDFASGWGTINGAALLNDLQALGPAVVRPVDLRPAISITAHSSSSSPRITAARRGRSIYLRATITVWAVPDSTRATYVLALSGKKALLNHRGTMTFDRSDRGLVHSITRRLTISRNAPRGTYRATFVVTAGGYTITAATKLVIS
ncbi:MAG TPA: S53 family peptidase [Chloroflexota bacterium]|nr:S53 family peptidase [Chloroflexota bacterium]